MSETTITCPKCGASLPLEDKRVIECRYCGTGVARPRDTATKTASDRPVSALVYAAVGVPAVVLGVLALVVLLRRSDTPVPPPKPNHGDPLASAPSPAPTPTPAPTPAAASTSAAPEPALADLAFAFGEKGTGAGQLDDARSIAVDPSGDIFVADYMSRRVQRFDATGKFVAAFRLDEGTQGGIIHGLAATYDGHLWVSRGGDLVELAMPDGKVVRTLLNHQPKLSYGGIAVDQTNTVYSANYGAGTFISMNGQNPQSDDVRKLDKNGSTLAIWKDIFRSGLGADLAVDGAGVLYASETHSPYVDVIDAHGKVKDRFRLKNHIGGGLAVDGKGRIFYATGRGVGVSDATGTALGTIGTLGVEGVALGPKSLLYALSRERVQVWTLH